MAVAVFVTLALAIAYGGSAMGAKSAEGCVKIWSPDAKVLSVISSGGGSETETHIDFKFRIAVEIITDWGTQAPFKRASEKNILPSEERMLLDILEGLCLVKSVAKDGPPPGGSTVIQVRYPDQTLTLAPKEGATSGETYFIMTDAAFQMLLKAVRKVTNFDYHGAP